MDIENPTDSKTRARSGRSSRLRILAVVLSLCTLSFAALQESGSATETPPKSLHRYASRTWYLDKLSGPASLSAEGRYLAYTNENSIHVHDLKNGKTETLAPLVGFERVHLFQWDSRGNRIEFKGSRQGGLARNIFDLDRGKLEDSPYPRNIFEVRFSRDGSIRSGWEQRRGRPAYWIDHLESGETYRAGRVRGTAMALSPSGRQFASLVLSTDGWSELHLFDTEAGERRVLAEGLDASYQGTAMAFSPDETELYLSLVQPKGTDLKDKHRPQTDRNLDIFAMNLESGEFRSVVDRKGDNLITAVTAKTLVWTNLQSSMKTAIVPFSGKGKPQILTDEQTSYPYWHPSGERVSVMHGEWHLADWALNWDISALDVADTGKPSGPLQPLVEGFHEDFNLAWSPDGKWMAYHSHRSPTPVSTYRGRGATDAIWLRSTEKSDPEIQLSQPGHIETLQPEWAPDSRRLVFCSAGRNRPYRATIVTIDPGTGSPVSEHLLEVPAIQGGVIGANWSPNGPELFLEEDRGENRRRLWRVSEDGTKAEALTDYESLVLFGGLDVSSDGETVVYFALAENGHHQLFSIERDGRNRKQLTHGEEELITPQISPDDRWIAASQYSHEKEVFEIPLD